MVSFVTCICENVDEGYVQIFLSFKATLLRFLITSAIEVVNPLIVELFNADYKEVVRCARE